MVVTESPRRQAPTTRPTPNGAVLLTVMRLTGRLWFNDLTRSLGRRPTVALLAFVVTLIAAYTAWSVSQTTAMFTGFNLHGAEATYGATVFTVPGIATTIAHLYAPTTSAIARMLCVLPLRRRSIHLSTRLFTGAIGLTSGGVLLAPLWVPIGLAGDVPRLRMLTALALIAAAGATVTTALLTCLSALLTDLLRAGSVTAAGLSALVTTAAFAATMGDALPMNHHDPAGVHTHVTARLLRWAAGEGGMSQALPLALVVVAAVAVVLVLEQGLSELGREAGPRVILPSWSSPQHRASLVRLELLQILRYPPNMLMLLFVNGLAAICALWVGGSATDQLGTGVILLTMISAWGVGAYGPTRRHHWVYRVTPRPRAWVYAKLAAVLAVWAAMVLIHGTWIVLATGMRPSDVLTMLPTMLVEVLIGCTVGILLPVSTDTSVSGALSEMTAVMVLVAVTAAIQSALTGLTSAVAVVGVQAMAVGVAVGTYVLVARAASAADGP